MQTLTFIKFFALNEDFYDTMQIYLSLLEAKCHKCDNKALVDEEMRIVSCPNCHSEISYEEYLEIMKNRAINMGFDFSNDLNKNPF